MLEKQMNLPGLKPGVSRRKARGMPRRVTARPSQHIAISRLHESARNLPLLQGGIPPRAKATRYPRN